MERPKPGNPDGQTQTVVHSVRSNAGLGLSKWPCWRSAEFLLCSQTGSVLSSVGCLPCWSHTPTRPHYWADYSWPGHRGWRSWHWLPWREPPIARGPTLSPSLRISRGRGFASVLYRKWKSMVGRIYHTYCWPSGRLVADETRSIPTGRKLRNERHSTVWRAVNAS